MKNLFRVAVVVLVAWTVCFAILHRLDKKMNFPDKVTEMDGMGGYK